MNPFVRLRSEPGRAFVRLKCQPYVMKDGVKNTDGACEFRLIHGAAHTDSAGLVWGWDGNAESPTISPSIACLCCGLHVTITGGVESGRAPVQPSNG